MICRGLAAAACLALVLAPTPAAVAARPHRVNPHRSKLTWATINICNTRAHPHTMGVRASMPGTGVRGEEMFMSFRVQYRDGRGRWQFARAPGSRPRDVGSATFRSRQSGINFPFKTTPGRPATLVRGAVKLQWRRGGRRGRAVATVRIHTTAGHSPAAGADPPGYSAATCRI